MATRNITNGEVQENTLRRPIEKVYTTAEVAKLTGKTPATVRRYARAGVLHAVRVKGQSRGIGYTAESVRALVEGRAE